MTDTDRGENKRRRVANDHPLPRPPTPVDLTRPSSDGRYWLDHIREHHPAIERAAKNRFRPDPDDEPGGDGDGDGDYLFCDEDDGDGVTEEERDEILSSTWKDEFVRREGFVRRLPPRPGPGPPPPAAATATAAGGCPPWPPPGYDPRPIDSYEFVVNFRKRLPMWRLPDGSIPTIGTGPDVTTIVTTVAAMSTSPGCDTFRDSPCSRHRGGTDFGSSVMIDLTPWRGDLPKLFTSGHFDDPEDRPDMEIIVIKRDGDGGGTSDEGRRGEERGVEVATLYGRTGMGNSFSCTKVKDEACCAKPFRAQYDFRAFSGPGRFGDEYFEDIHGVGEGNPNRPWLPRVEPYLHERGTSRGEAGSRWELHLGIKWGGSDICERYEPMGERDVRAFLEHGLAWRRVGRDSEELAYLHDAARGGRQCWSPTSPPPGSAVEPRGLGADMGRFEETYSHELRDSLPRFTFLVDLYEMRGEDDGTPSSPSAAESSSSSPTSIISVDVPTSGRVRDGRLALDVTDARSGGAVRDWLSGRSGKGAEIGGMVTVIERGTGKQAQLFVGRVVTNTHAGPSVAVGRGYKYFQSFAALHYFSKDEAYSRVIWPETVLRVAPRRDGGVSFAVGFHWFDSSKKAYHAMEDHLIHLFLKHALVYN